MAVGIGISLNNAHAVLTGLLPGDPEFRRTPKYALDEGASLATRRYRARVGPESWGELLLSAYFLGLVAAALTEGLWGAVPFLALFAGGFTFTAWSSLRWAGRRRAAP
jgi:hypothetical protein